MEAYGDPLDENVIIGSCESQLREDLAEAMLEISIASHRAPGKCTITQQNFVLAPNCECRHFAVLLSLEMIE